MERVRDDAGGRSGAPSVCLNMIVRNEAHVVAETLDAVAPHIDHWVVVDTGSTDDTIAVVRSFFAERGIPGELYERPWRDFGTNRTEALELAAGRADYTWVIDADDLVVGDFDLSGLAADAYSVRYGTDFVFWRTQIFRSSLPWRYEGVLHEYPVCDAPDVRIDRLEGDYHLVWRTLGGRSKGGDKFQRDVEVLTNAHEADPDDPRTVFYLAQSHRDAGNLDEARALYLRRAEMGGWAEEIYVARLEAARCLRRSGAPWPEVQAELLDAWSTRPHRGEALHDLASHHRAGRNWAVGHLFATRGLALPVPDDDLFVDATVHRWRLLDEASICAYYLGHHQESVDGCRHLLAGPDLPDHERPRVEENLRFALEVVQDAHVGHRPDLVAGLVSVATERAAGLRPPSDVTLTITAGRRRELFEATIDSFLTCCEDADAIGRWICVDDGSPAADRAALTERYPFIEFVWKDPADAGHARSLNLLRDLVDTPYWLHLEDDWKFVVRDRYVERAKAILDADPALGQVLFNRAYAETLDDLSLVGGSVAHTPSGARYWRHEHLEGDELAAFLADLPAGARTNAWWPHYSLRPALLRTVAVEALGPYDEDAGHVEKDFAVRYAAAGLRTAAFDEITCLHTGPLTSERGPRRRPNAYDLAGDHQFTSADHGSGSGAVPFPGVDLRVVNLDRRPDRMADLDARFRAAAGDLLVDRMRRVPAVDGQDLELTDEIRHLFRHNDHGFRRAIVGCALSHIGLWRTVAQSGRPTLVFEDDARPVDGFSDLLEALIDEVPPDGGGPGVILLGAHVYDEEADRRSLPADGLLRVVDLEPANYLGGTHGYLLTPAGARTLLDLVDRDGVQQGIDWFLRSHAEEVHVARTRPDLVESDLAWPGRSGDSDIQHDFTAL